MAQDPTSRDSLLGRDAAAAGATPLSAQLVPDEEEQGAATPLSLGTQEVVVGTAGNDLIRGGGGSDQIFGGLGNDIIFGRGGDDELRGEDGNDGIVGGAGNDRLVGGDGLDRMAGSSGNDKLFGQGDGDFLRGDGGNDRIDGGADGDIILGHGGDDTIFGRDGGDRVASGNGDDRIFGGAGDDRLMGQGGADVITGGPGADEFVYSSRSHAGDRIIDWAPDDGDVLDLIGPLDGAEVRMVDDGVDTTVSVRPAGAQSFTELVVLENFVQSEPPPPPPPTGPGPLEAQSLQVSDVLQGNDGLEPLLAAGSSSNATAAQTASASGPSETAGPAVTLSDLLVSDEAAMVS